jgi:hypothetical protein
MEALPQTQTPQIRNAGTIKSPESQTNKFLADIFETRGTKYKGHERPFATYRKRLNQEEADQGCKQLYNALLSLNGYVRDFTGNRVVESWHQWAYMNRNGRGGECVANIGEEQSQNPKQTQFSKIGETRQDARFDYKKILSVQVSLNKQK